MQPEFILPDPLPSSPNPLQSNAVPDVPAHVIRGPFAMIRVYGPGERSVEISREPMGYAADVYRADQFVYRCRHSSDGGITRRSCYSPTPELALELARIILASEDR